jgi:hypothetical protein
LRLEVDFFFPREEVVDRLLLVREDDARFVLLLEERLDDERFDLDFFAPERRLLDFFFAAMNYSP